MKQILLKTWLIMLCLMVGVGTTWADTYEQLTSISNIDESADYVLGIDGTGFHKSGTSSWGVCTNSGGGTPLTYKLVKASDGNSFKASTEISGTTYYLTVPTSNTFTMATSSTAGNTDMIIGTTQVSETNYAVANKGTTARHLRLNGASGLRSYAGTTGTMAFFYKVVPDGPAVTSITIKTAPTKTTYMVGEKFDPTGLVITKSLSDENTADVAYNNETKDEFTFNPSLGTELSDETYVSITYAKKSANQAIKVNPFVATAGTYNVIPNNVFWGKSTQDGAVSVSKNTVFGPTEKFGVEFEMNSGESTNSYMKSDHSRAYSGYTLKLTAPSGFNLTAVKFTGSTWVAPSANVGTVNSKNWTGETGEVTFSFSGTSYLSNIEVTYAESNTPPTPELTLIGIEATGTPAEFWKGDEFNHNGITVTALWDDENETDVTSECEFSGYDMNTAGQQTVTVTYQEETCQYNIEVKTIANTQAEAYTVAQAKDLIDASKDLATEVYVKGTVSEIVTAWSDQYENITYNISADGETTGQQFQLYRCVTNGAEVGDDVVAYGTLTKYNSTYEFTEGNTIVKRDKVATLSIADITVANDEDINPVITTNVTGEYAIEYVSDNEEIVLADGDELVVMGTGNATITATLVADGYKTAETTFKVTVTIPAPSPLSVTLGGALAKTTYTIGDTFDRTGLTVTAKLIDDSDVDVTESATWEVDPEELSTAGNITVTVSASYGGKEDIQEYEVTVNKKEANISFASATLDVEVGKNITLEPTTTPADAEISYTIEEGDSYVSLENGVVTGVAEGTATIRADYAGNGEYDAASTTVTINVIPADPTTTVTYNFTSFDSAKKVEFTDLDGFTITLNGNGGTNPAWVSNTARVYAGGSLTVTADNAIIKSIEYAYTVNANNKGVTPTIDGVAGTTDAGTWDVENKTWTGADEEVTFSTSGTAGNIGFTKLIIKYVEGNKITPTLSFSAPTATVTIGADNNVFPTLTTTPADLEGVTYESSDINVATIDENTGVITLIAAGETTITAKFAGNDDYKAATPASYTLTVVKAPFVPTPAPEGYEVVNFAALYSSVTTSATVEDYEGTSFSMAFAKPQSSNTPTKYYDNGKAVRAYEDNTITITGAEAITNVDIVWSVEDEAVSVTGLGTPTAVVTFSKTCRFTAITVGYKKFDLTVTDAGYATLCLPFNATKPEGAAVYTGKYNQNGTVTLNEVTNGKLKAGEGYIVANEGSHTFCITSDVVETPENNNLKGVTERTQLTADRTIYIFANQSKGVGFYILNQNAYLAANKAYLKVPAGESAREFVGFGDGETAIENIIVEPMKDGKYLQNGKIFIIKNGVKYNVNGQRMR